MPLGRRRFAGLALPLARRGLRLLARPGALHHRDQARARASRRARRSCCCATSAWRAISTAARSCARRTATSSTSCRQRLVGRVARAACWAACWWSACRSACPAARSTAKAAPSRPTPTPSLGVNIQRLDADKAGTLILLAQAAVEFNRPRRSAARTFTHRQARAGARPSRARSPRSATPSASLPTASRRCCSLMSSSAATSARSRSMAEPLRDRDPELRECLGCGHVPDRAGARARHALRLRALRHRAAPHPRRPVEPRPGAQLRRAGAVRRAVDAPC